MLRVPLPSQQTIVAPLQGYFPTQVKLDIPVSPDFSMSFQATIPFKRVEYNEDLQVAKICAKYVKKPITQSGYALA